MSIKFLQTNKNLSAYGGLIIGQRAAKALEMEKLLESCLPKNSKPRSSFRKFYHLMFGLITGADCLDDMEKLSHDQGFQGFCDDQVYTPKTYGNFLRDFLPENILDLQEALMRLAFEIHLKLYPNDQQFFFDMDSTPNFQYAKKMEGVAHNYQKKKCLDTLNVFDKKGLQYFVNVRAGNTHTSRGAEGVIHRLMTVFQEYKLRSESKWKACFRGDRGYYNSGFINACFAKNADVIVGVRQDIHHFPLIVNQIHNWRATDANQPERVKFYDGREVEIGTTNYRPVGYQRRLRYIVMRAKKPAEPLFPDYVEYEYYAFATTYSEQLMSDEKVILCYRERGTAENFIKENKYGLDMKHYPCLKLNANRTYALISAFAYNLMRFLSLANNPNKPIYSKRIRFQWINIPSLVARTGGNIVLKFMSHHFKEVSRWFKIIDNLHLGKGFI